MNTHIYTTQINEQNAIAPTSIYIDRKIKELIFPWLRMEYWCNGALTVMSFDYPLYLYFVINLNVEVHIRKYETSIFHRCDVLENEYWKKWITNGAQICIVIDQISIELKLKFVEMFFSSGGLTGCSWGHCFWGHWFVDNFEILN